MAYDYQQEKAGIFTETGLQMLLKIRDRADKLLKESGAFREQELHTTMSGDSWKMLACVDFLVEKGELKRIHDGGVRQMDVYVRGSE